MTKEEIKKELTKRSIKQLFYSMIYRNIQITKKEDFEMTSDEMVELLIKNAKINSELINNNLPCIINSNYFDTLIDMVSDNLSKIKCKLTFIDMPTFMDSEGSPQVIRNRMMKDWSILDDESKTLYLYTLAMIHNEIDEYGIYTCMVDLKTGEVENIDGVDLNKTFYLRCHY